MPIHVTSEIGPLRRVLLQRPGRELEHLSPETMEQLLFDDIPFLHRAQQEHDRFAELLRENGFEDAAILMLRSTGDPAELMELCRYNRSNNVDRASFFAQWN